MISSTWVMSLFQQQQSGLPQTDTSLVAPAGAAQTLTQPRHRLTILRVFFQRPLKPLCGDCGIAGFNGRVAALHEIVHLFVLIRIQASTG